MVAPTPPGIIRAAAIGLNDGTRWSRLPRREAALRATSPTRCRGYTGVRPAEATAPRGIRLAVVQRPAAKRGFVLLPWR